MKTLGWLAMITCVLGISTVELFAQTSTNAPRAGEVPAPLQLRKVIQGPPINEMTWETLKGKLVVLEFWNTECKPCIESIPHLNEMAEHFKGKPVVFLSVSDDPEDRLAAFLKQHPMRSWLALDGADNATEHGFHLQGYGLIVLIDPGGKVAGVTLPAFLQPKHLDRILAGELPNLPVLQFLPSANAASSTNSNSAPQEKSN